MEQQFHCYNPRNSQLKSTLKYHRTGRQGMLLDSKGGSPGSVTVDVIFKNVIKRRYSVKTIHFYTIMTALGIKKAGRSVPGFEKNQCNSTNIQV